MPGPDEPEMTSNFPQTPRAKRVIECAIAEANGLNHNYVGTEHLLLGLVREGEGVAAQVLINMGVKLEDIRKEVTNLLGHNRVDGPRLDEPPPPTHLPAPIRGAVNSIAELIALFDRMKGDAVAAQDFDWASKLNDQAKKLVKMKEILVREQHREPNDLTEIAD